MRSKGFWIVLATIILAVVALAAYFLLRPHHREQVIRAALTGYVLEVKPDVNRITVRNDAIPEMRSMVMDYCVKNGAALAGIHPGDSIQATMIADDTYCLEEIKVTGKQAAGQSIHKTN